SVALRYGATSSELAQGFQVDTSGPIPFVDIKVQKTLAPTGNLWAEIHSDSGGTPVDGPLAISAYVSMANVSTSAQWIRFVFRTPYVVTAGTQYHLILQGSNVADATNYINIRMDNTSPAYARGILQRRHNGTWDDMSADALFCVYVTRNDNAVAPPAGYDTGTLTATIHTLTDLSSALPPVPVRVSQYTTLSTVAGSRLWILGDYSLVGSYDADVYAQAANYWLAQAAPVLVEYQAVYLKVSANDQRFSFDGYRW
ncbi:MAG: hypothetical protein NTY02_09300, partial [Acidobacteria bacterium]|nr:hypothetical protein [Acidobacteriota bacterium]